MSLTSLKGRVQKLTCGVYGPFLFVRRTIRYGPYLDMLHLFLLPQLEEDNNMNIVFHQDDTPLTEPRSIIATALRNKGYSVYEEVHGISSEGSNRRIDIIAFKPPSLEGYIIDPAVRFESHERQPEEVHEAKRNIYEPSISFYKDKYHLESIVITGLMIGARGTIPRLRRSFVEENIMHLFIPQTARPAMQNCAPNAAYVTSRTTSFIPSFKATRHPHDKVACVSSDGSTRRVDIIIIDRQKDKGVILDPTIRFEMHEQQPQELYPRWNGNSGHEMGAIPKRVKELRSKSRLTRSRVTQVGDSSGSSDEGRGENKVKKQYDLRKWCGGEINREKRKLKSKRNSALSYDEEWVEHPHALCHRCVTVAQCSTHYVQRLATKGKLRGGT
ncbi:hypothetical protein ANN_23835 [Periplaneta americana]|uniref:Uncharacterized protein n=1 Tax=Periplaneta americana TaxID=6978 RepID=A0ABQ8SNI3_PERAM|nr:hypothetical protein ANN_23835 [Periplaneta americana]